MSDSRGRGFDPRESVQRIRTEAASKVAKRKESVGRIDTESVKGAARMAPNALRRALADSTPTGILTKAPVVTVVLCLVVTGFFTLHSGVLDCREGFDNPDLCDEESALNVNGDLEVYLPQGSEVSAWISVVEEDWTTNVMVIYVESEDTNVTTVNILNEIDAEIGRASCRERV